MTSLRAGSRTVDNVFSHTTTVSSIAYAQGVLTVAFSGPSLAEREASIVGKEIESAMAAAGKSLRVLVLDMDHLETMSSIGLGVCIDARNAARGRGATTIIYRLHARLRELFKMTRVDRLFEMVQDASDLERAGAVRRR